MRKPYRAGRSTIQQYNAQKAEKRKALYPKVGCYPNFNNKVPFKKGCDGPYIERRKVCCAVTSSGGVQYINLFGQRCVVKNMGLSDELVNTVLWETTGETL